MKPPKPSPGESLEAFMARVKAYTDAKRVEYEAQARQRGIMWRKAFLTRPDLLPAETRTKLRKELDEMEGGT